MGIRGIVLAGGKGTRLGELTKVTNKHLLPVGQYPMVYHPLKKVVGAGIKDVLLVSGTEHMGDFVELLGSGKDHGCALTYRVQDEAGGIAQALGLAETFSAGHRSLVILGDNIFQAPVKAILDRRQAPEGPGSYSMGRTRRYGVAELEGNRVIGIEEKPKKPKSDYAVIGVYIYPADVFEVIKTLKPSGRGELEITDVNNHYLKAGRMGFSIIDGYWTDAGTLDSLAHANQLVRENPPVF